MSARRANLEVKLLPHKPHKVSETGLFEGYASLFGIADLARDVVMPGAFARSLSTRGARGVRMLWQHDPGEPIGTWLRMPAACSCAGGSISRSRGRARSTR